MFSTSVAMLLTVLLVVGATLAWCFLMVMTTGSKVDPRSDACAFYGSVPTLFASIAVVAGWIWYHVR